MSIFQVDKAYQKLTNNAVNNGRINIKLTSGQGYAYASIIDNHTGDPTTEYPTIIAPPAPTYTTTVYIRVRDHGKVYEQYTHPPIGDVMLLENVNNPDATLGNLGFPCGSNPDPVVNTIDKWVANYKGKLTPAQQQEVSGDATGFLPFIYYNYPSTTTPGSLCDPTDPDQDWIDFISMDVDKN